MSLSEHLMREHVGKTAWAESRKQTAATCEQTWCLSGLVREGQGMARATAGERMHFQAQRGNRTLRGTAAAADSGAMACSCRMERDTYSPGPKKGRSV
eukprot:CAMPEP_0175692948 /NCGR_PEP_ID=MMETSP0097-20121207/31177_1 /TAXON_ID=311494 /ORGANISM="Alexandrium monilatum, Strain CCMP3105" /LENGTH=97 /DNA_ID=CAMNT_0017000047 /DNA_START=12 /DNA_END=302 /DNA_ORIENTATION=+